MPSFFDATKLPLEQVLSDCKSGLLQLPDFQRGWVWDESRIRGLIASISRSFPVGTLMTLETGGEVAFQARPVEGAPFDAKNKKPHSLLLDGQQRMTSLFQALMRTEPVETVTDKKKPARLFFYFDMNACAGLEADREEAIVTVQEDRVRRGEGNQIKWDLSTADKEYAAKCFPLSLIFDYQDWRDGFIDFWKKQEQDVNHEFRAFRSTVLDPITKYQIPLIELGSATSREAVCTVFEKVNTGGKVLDAFELVTAQYAASGYQLRDDWTGKTGKIGRRQKFFDWLRKPDEKQSILSEVAASDFLQAVSLFYTRKLRNAAEHTGKQGKDLPQVTGNRQALLSLPLSAYLEFQEQVERGFLSAAQFLYELHIFSAYDLPYQTQLIPLAAILADLGDSAEHQTVKAKLERWYWCGVFGELYGSAVESRAAKDFIQVPDWIRGGPEPSTVQESTFRSERLNTMRMRISAAYKGLNILLMRCGALDFRTGAPFGQTVYFNEQVDIHHVFPKAWCKTKKIEASVYDSILNKTPLTKRTNQKLGGSAPSAYLEKLEKGDLKDPPIKAEVLDRSLASHMISEADLRSDNFNKFLENRRYALLKLIKDATGKEVSTSVSKEDLLLEVSQDPEDVIIEVA